MFLKIPRINGVLLVSTKPGTENRFAFLTQRRKNEAAFEPRVSTSIEALNAKGHKISIDCTPTTGGEYRLATQAEQEAFEALLKEKCSSWADYYIADMNKAMDRVRPFVANDERRFFLSHTEKYEIAKAKIDAQELNETQRAAAIAQLAQREKLGEFTEGKKDWSKWIYVRHTADVKGEFYDVLTEGDADEYQKIAAEQLQD